MTKQSEAESRPESTLFVYVAMAVDLAVALSRLVVGLIAGSTAMLAEAATSFANTTDQVFLLVGIKLSDRPADEDHPMATGRIGSFGLSRGRFRSLSIETSGPVSSHVQIGQPSAPEVRAHCRRCLARAFA
jgi:hypothetical protein